jgi:hypothetical protein
MGATVAPAIPWLRESASLPARYRVTRRGRPPRCRNSRLLSAGDVGRLHDLVLARPHEQGRIRRICGLTRRRVVRPSSDSFLETQAVSKMCGRRGACFGNLFAGARKNQRRPSRCRGPPAADARRQAIRVIGTSQPLILSELLAAISLATDLGRGFPQEKALRTCLVATRLAEELGLDDQARADTFYAALIHPVGCTAFTYEGARVGFANSSEAL